MEYAAFFFALDLRHLALYTVDKKYLRTIIFKLPLFHSQSID